MHGGTLSDLPEATAHLMLRFKRGVEADDGRFVAALLDAPRRAPFYLDRLFRLGVKVLYLRDPKYPSEWTATGLSRRPAHESIERNVTTIEGPRVHDQRLTVHRSGVGVGTPIGLGPGIASARRSPGAKGIGTSRKNSVQVNATSDWLRWVRFSSVTKSSTWGDDALLTSRIRKTFRCRSYTRCSGDATSGRGGRARHASARFSCVDGAIERTRQL
ncbi:MAG: hypothetical protein AAFU79_11625 [Myxococcota bacterium]